MGEHGHTPERIVWMTRRLATRWVLAHVKPEYRVRVLLGSHPIRNLTGLLHSFRDGRAPLEGVPQIEDLGVRELTDGVELWSSSREGLLLLSAWFEMRGCETSGVW